MIQIKLNMKGMPTPRARVSSTGGYNTEEYKNYKNLLQAKMRGFKKMPIAPLRVELFFGFEASPGALKGTNKYPVPKGDVDNMAKGILDAANKMLLFEDDVLVEELVVTKRYATRNVIFITITVIDNT